MTDLLLNDVRLPDGTAADVLISRGRIECIGPGLSAPADVAREPGGGRCCCLAWWKGIPILTKPLGVPPGT